MDYNLAKFEADISNIKPRIFDTYILPPFLMWYAVKSKDMKRNTRRALFVAGVYMAYRSYAQYKQLLADATAKFTAPKAPETAV